MRAALSTSEHPPLENPTDAASTEMALQLHSSLRGSRSLGWNYLFSALAGATWYLQFFFYTMGETQMGRYKFSSWTLHMASIIIFSTLWGIALEGVAWREQADQDVGDSDTVGTGGIDHDCGLWELPGVATLRRICSQNGAMCG